MSPRCDPRRRRRPHKLFCCRCLAVSAAIQRLEAMRCDAHAHIRSHEGRWRSAATATKRPSAALSTALAERARACARRRPSSSTLRVLGRVAFDAHAYDRRSPFAVCELMLMGVYKHEIDGDRLLAVCRRSSISAASHLIDRANESRRRNLTRVYSRRMSASRRSCQQ